MTQVNVDDSASPGEGYPTGTGRVLVVSSKGETCTDRKTIALIGDHTLDNGYWVDIFSLDPSYSKKTHTVSFQTAHHLGTNESSMLYRLYNLAVDGATTRQVLGKGTLKVNKEEVLRERSERALKMNKVAKGEVKPLVALSNLKPDTVVLSIGSSDYLHNAQNAINRDRLGFFPRFISESTRTGKETTFFRNVQLELLENYKAIIDKIIKENRGMSRLVLVTQYYPALAIFPSDFIYTAFTQIAWSQDLDQSAFMAMKTTIEKLYNNIIEHLAKVAETKENLEIVLVDMTTSMSPVKENHTFQMIPDERGSELMGLLIAEAIAYKFNKKDKDCHVKLHLNNDEKSIKHEPLLPKARHEPNSNNHIVMDSSFIAPTIEGFISKDRYTHLVPSTQSSFVRRVANTFYLFAGKRFDAQYAGPFAFGLIDLSLVSIAAAYLWRVGINPQIPEVLRIPALVLSAPIQMLHTLCSIALTLASMPLIIFFHVLGKVFNWYTQPEKQSASIASRP